MVVSITKCGGNQIVLAMHDFLKMQHEQESCCL